MRIKSLSWVLCSVITVAQAIGHNHYYSRQPGDSKPLINSYITFRGAHLSGNLLPRNRKQELRVWRRAHSEEHSAAGHTVGSNIGGFRMEDDDTVVIYHGGIATSADKSLTIEFIYKGSAVFFFGNGKATAAAIFIDRLETQVRAAAQKAQTDGTGGVVKIRSPDQAEARQIARIVKSVLPRARISVGLFEPRYLSRGHWNFEVHPGNEFVFSAWDPDTGKVGGSRSGRSRTPPTPKTLSDSEGVSKRESSGRKRRPATSESGTSEVQSRRKQRFE